MNNQHLLIIANRLNPEHLDSIKQVRRTLSQSSDLKKISLLFVSPYIASNCYALPSLVEYLKTSEQKATNTLNHWGRNLGVTLEDQWLSQGNIRQEIIRATKQLNVDFVLTSESIKHALTHRVPFVTQHATTLIRCFEKLYLFSTLSVTHQPKVHSTLLPCDTPA